MLQSAADLGLVSVLGGPVVGIAVHVEEEVLGTGRPVGDVRVERVVARLLGPHQPRRPERHQEGGTGVHEGRRILEARCLL
ncbi:hypothetical protein ACKI2C_00975 [Streptomyces brasiliscabiei]|uniref:hypothetical protein n=1 Tax=Streptomyces brasiliscabiei TaxID=2736302 RepID=UPI0038F7DEC5